MNSWRKLCRLASGSPGLTEICCDRISGNNVLGVPERVVIEAVELAKRYSGDEGHRFINGVLSSE